MDDLPVIADQLRGLLKPLDELPMDVWLPDAAGQPVTPAIARTREINPHEPLCAVRYDGNPVDIWMRLIEAGTLAPLMADVKSDALISPRSMGERAIQRLILKKLGYATGDTSAGVDILSSYLFLGLSFHLLLQLSPYLIAK